MILLIAIALLFLGLIGIMTTVLTENAKYAAIGSFGGVIGIVVVIISAFFHSPHMENENNIYASEHNMKDAYYVLHSEYSNPFVHVISGPDSIKQLPDTDMIERVDIIKTNDDDMLVKLDVIQKNNDNSYEKKSLNALMTTDSYKSVTNNIYQANQDYNLDDIFGAHDKTYEHINVPGKNIQIDSDINRIQKILDKK